MVQHNCLPDPTYIMYTLWNTMIEGTERCTADLLSHLEVDYFDFFRYFPFRRKMGWVKYSDYAESRKQKCLNQLALCRSVCSCLSVLFMERQICLKLVTCVLKTSYIYYCLLGCLGLDWDCFNNEDIVLKTSRGASVLLKKRHKHFLDIFSCFVFIEVFLESVSFQKWHKSFITIMFYRNII